MSVVTIQEVCLPQYQHNVFHRGFYGGWLAIQVKINAPSKSKAPPKKFGCPLPFKSSLSWKYVDSKLLSKWHPFHTSQHLHYQNVLEIKWSTLPFNDFAITYALHIWLPTTPLSLENLWRTQHLYTCCTTILVPQCTYHQNSLVLGSILLMNNMFTLFCKTRSVFQALDMVHQQQHQFSYILKE